MNKSLLSIFIVLFSIFTFATLVSAQSFYDKKEWEMSLLEAFFGKLPYACGYSVDPLCFKCLVYMKILPMLFFFLLFFLLFYLILWETAANRPSSPLEVIVGQTGSKKMTHRETKIAALLSLVMSIVFLHYGDPTFAIRNLNIWMGVFLFVGTLLLFRGFAKATVAFFLVQMIILIVMLLLFSTYWNIALNPQINEIISECMGGV